MCNARAFSRDGKHVLNVFACIRCHLLVETVEKWGVDKKIFGFIVPDFISCEDKRAGLTSRAGCEYCYAYSDCYPTKKS